MEKLYSILHQTINSRKDFDDSFYSKFSMTEAVDENVTTNQYFYNTSTNTLSVNNGGTRANIYRIFFNGMSVGDKIELEFDVLFVSGTGVNVQIQETTTKGSAATSTPYLQIVEPEQIGVWQRVRKTFFAKTPNNIYVCVGLSSLAGNIKLRNVSARVKRRIGMQTSEKVNVFKKANITKTSSGWSKRTDYLGENVTLTEADANTLQITYETPFVGLKPVVIIDSQFSSSTYKYIPKTSNSILTGFQIRFYDFAGVVVPLASLTNDIFVGFMAIGEKSYFE